MATTRTTSKPTMVIPVLFLLIATTLAGTETNTFSTKLPTSPVLNDFLSESKAIYDESLNDMKTKTIGVALELKNAEAKRKVIKVSKDGKGDFKTVTDAVKSIPSGNGRRIIIKIGPGVYKEKIRVDKTKHFVTFYGDPKNMPTITYNSRAKEVGTWESATVAVRSKYFVAANIIFENTSPDPGMGSKGGQAVALRISGDKAAFYNCKFYGFQDTLCDDKGNHYYKDCYIRGTEDFIFGNARSLYVNCHIESVSREGVTAITAQGRETLADKSGFSFVHCTISGTGHAHLSRAWRSKSRVVFSYTSMGSVVNPEGWDNWGEASNDKSVFYAEYKCSGKGSATNSRVKYGKTLTDAQAEPFLSPTFIHGATWLQPPPSV